MPEIALSAMLCVCLFVCVCMHARACVCVRAHTCSSAPGDSNNYSCETRRFKCIVPAIGILDGCSLSNKVHSECLPKETSDILLLIHFIRDAI